MPKAEPFIEIEARNFEELGKRFAKSREFMLVALNEALRRAGGILTPAIKDATPVGATKKLKNTTVFQVIGKAEDMRMEVRQSAQSEKGFAYGVAVRTGTKPHFPPIDALVPWVRAKLNVPAERVRQVAFLIARKISRVGTKPNPYHVKAFESNVGRVKDAMKDAVVDFVARIGDIPEAH